MYHNWGKCPQDRGVKMITKRLIERLAPNGCANGDVWIDIIYDLADLIFKEEKLGLGTLGNFEWEGFCDIDDSFHRRVGFTAVSEDNKNLLTLHGIFGVIQRPGSGEILKVWGMVDEHGSSPKWLRVDFKYKKPGLTYFGHYTNLGSLIEVIGPRTIFATLFEQIRIWETKAEKQLYAAQTLRKRSQDLNKLVQQLSPSIRPS